MNMLWIDVKYARIAGQSLDQFKVKKDKPFSATYRCPYCGDSQKNRLKTRGYFYESQGKVSSKCFNCGISKTISSFLYDKSPQLYKEYKLETLKDAGGATEEYSPFKETKSKKVINNNFVSGLKKLSQLPKTHPAVVYCDNRKIPASQHYRIYYTDKFFHWVNENLIEDKFSHKTLMMDSPRLVFLFRDTSGGIVGAQGRSLTKVEPRYRYITVMKEGHQKLFGLETLSFSDDIVIVEGTIDTLFIKNSIAMAGADVKVNNLPYDKLIFWYDNEPRNQEIVNRMRKVIDDGYRICIWPDTVKCKDVNDAVLMGIDPQMIINSNTFSGLEAKLRLTAWAKL